MKLVLSVDALGDLERLYDFLMEKDPASAARAAGRLSDAMGSLLRFPDRGRACAIKDLRELFVPFGKSAFVLRYAHLRPADEIVIVRIWHGREEKV